MPSPSLHHVDLAIVAIYLVMILLIGLKPGKQVKTIREYAVAHKNFSTLVVVTTIFATFIGGAATLGVIEKTHSSNVYFALIFLAFPVSMMLVAKYIAPHMGKFKGCTSCGDIMFMLYGREAQVMAGLTVFLTAAASIAGQVMAMGYLAHYFTGVDYTACTLISAGIVVVYSAFGGIKAVTFTDFFQFWIIIIAIPVLCVLGLIKVGGYSNILHAVPHKHIDVMSNIHSISTYILPYFIAVAVPMPAVMVQRLLISKDSMQIQKSMKIAAYLIVPFIIMMVVIGLITIYLYPNVSSKIVLPTFVNEIAPIGLRGLIFTGFLAVIMSTADSFLNTASISFVHDTLKPLLGSRLIHELAWAKVLTFVTGVVSIAIATHFKQIIDIFAAIQGVWTSTIMAPMGLGIVGITLTRRHIKICLALGLSFYLIWQFWLIKIFHMNSAFMGLVFNLLVFFALYGVEKLRNA